MPINSKSRLCKIMCLFDLIQTGLLSYRDLASIDITLFMKRTTKALIRLRGCAG